ncbi:proton-conducting transporter membrane subunit [Candidatus Thiothrix sp. Deng01]|uniref:Proton-conducting transporter membrane subunit n=1 Tax=Candidatus Thiothrix phosphatis TaxID=3112415 RepID=A0ABU6CZ06_9GAMM|nr:proton-conducting transporter membrane subunit [Candidatus Thiothrix sp. Deng01]MEB4591318.1 proton-conducting transporter membrane subunit [Candidatus Thiothrix sp. Deng01]
MTFSEIPASSPLLGVLQLLPLLTGLVLIRVRGEAAVALASIVSLAQLFLTVNLYLQFDLHQPAGVMQFAESFPLLGAFHYHAAVDGVSVMFVLLTVVINLLNVAFTLVRRLHQTSLLAVMMVTQSVIISMFVTVDLLWFTIMSLLETLLVGYMIKCWPTSHDVQPTLARYLQFMAVGLGLTLFGTLLLGWNYADAHGGQWSFSLYELAEMGFGQHSTVATLVFFSLFYGLGIRTPLFPLHGWLPSFMQHGNVASAPIYLLGLKVGVYGLLRFVFPIVPHAVWEWHTIATIFAATGVFYAAFLAMRQQTLRELLAFAVISHTGILTIGLFSLHAMALQGAVLLALNFGLAITGLLLMTGMVWQRTRTTRLSKLGGLLDYIPIVGLAFLVAGLAIVGMPGTPGFDAVHFVLEGSIKRFGALVTVAAALGNLVAAGFLLRAFQRAFLAEPGMDTSRWDKNPAYPAEQVMAVIVILVTVVVGFYSAPWIELIREPVNGLSGLFAEYAGDVDGGGH